MRSSPAIFIRIERSLFAILGKFQYSYEREIPRLMPVERSCFFRKRKFDTEKLLVCLSAYFWGLVVLLSVLLYFSPISFGVHLLYVVWFWIYVCYRVRVSNHCVSPQKSIYLELTQIGTNFFFSREKQMIAIIEITLNKIII